jgi:7,8-dihydro-6-hydroxymethylpterin-pyrophosphokinase
MMFNDEELELGHRIIPSREILERPFVAIPLAEIAPYLRHPVTGDQMKAIAKKFSVDPEEMVARRDLSFKL